MISGVGSLAPLHWGRLWVLASLVLLDGRRRTCCLLNPTRFFTPHVLVSHWTTPQVTYDVLPFMAFLALVAVAVGCYMFYAGKSVRMSARHCRRMVAAEPSCPRKWSTWCCTDIICIHSIPAQHSRRMLSRDCEIRPWVLTDPRLVRGVASTHVPPVGTLCDLF